MDRAYTGIRASHIAGAALFLCAAASLKAPPPSGAGRGSQTVSPPASPGALPCLPLDCSGVSTAPSPGFGFPSSADFTPDRRPARGINLFGGAQSHPPSGGPDWWHVLDDLDGNGLVDGVDSLLDVLDDAYADGWRRMMIILPAGSYPGIFASSQWWTMPLEKRLSLTAALPAWLAVHADATLGIVAGFGISDPCQLCMHTCFECFDDDGVDQCALCPECAGAPLAHSPLTTSSQDMCVVHQNVEPWIDAGLYEIWFDRSGGTVVEFWEAMLRLAGNPDYVGRIRFGSEPVANDGQGGGTNEPILSVIQRMPFFSLRRYYEIFGGDAPPQAWTFDPATTEVHVVFGDTQFCVDQVPGDGVPCTDCPEWCDGVPDPPAIDVVYDFVQRGYIPQPRGHLAGEYVRRIYDQNVETIPCPDDLDVDGDVDALDADRLAANIGMTTGATLYHGDIDFDDDVDVIDYFLLVSHPGFPGPCN